MREKLSVLIPTFNEEENIAECIRSIGDLADELMVLDSYSADHTVEIARAAGASVRQRIFDNYALNKNAGMELLQHPWILIVDADERVTDSLRDEIRELLSCSPALSAFSIRRDTFFGKRRVRCWSTGRVIRLFRKQSAKYLEATTVHEELSVPGETGCLKHPLQHFTFRSFSQYLPKMDSFTTLAAREALEKGMRASWHHLIFLPPGRFLKTYLIRQGFMDGIPGLVISFLSAYSIFLKYAKLWELQNSKPAE